LAAWRQLLTQNKAETAVSNISVDSYKRCIQREESHGNSISSSSVGVSVGVLGKPFLDLPWT
jgi:hypothetical protein